MTSPYRVGNTCIGDCVWHDLADERLRALGRFEGDARSARDEARRQSALVRGFALAFVVVTIAGAVCAAVQNEENAALRASRLELRQCAGRVR